MTQSSLRLGTRGSQLALTQSGMIARAIERVSGRPVELVTITTHGDVHTGSLATIGGTGVFVTAVRDALINGEIDVAVHSLKDLPTQQPEGIRLGAIPPRESPYDALCCSTATGLSDLKQSAVVATGSPRRVAQLLAIRPDLRIVDIRGNIDTRLRSLDKHDAVVLACAGLRRMDRSDAITETLTSLLPAPGQGALAVECRQDDDETFSILSVLDDIRTRTAVFIERNILAVLEAGCSAPVGALAQWEADGLTLNAGVFAPDGSRQILSHIQWNGKDVPEAVGEQCAKELIDQGAMELMA